MDCWRKSLNSFEGLHFMPAEMKSLFEKKLISSVEPGESVFTQEDTDIQAGVPMLQQNFGSQGRPLVARF